MRKILALVLIGLGAFLVVGAVVAQAWVPGQVERTPLDTDSTTYLEGRAQVPNADLELEETPVKAFSVNRVDADVSDDDVVTFVSSLCLVRDEGGIDGCVDTDDPEGRLISAETGVFATDRHTGMSVNGEEYLPADTPEQDGLQNKFPFGTEQRTYPVWEGMVGHAIDATYEGTEDLDGLEVYVFQADVDAAGVEVLDGMTGSFVGATTYYIEPVSGAIVNQVVHQERTVDGVGPILDLDLQFTDEQVATNIADSKDNVATLDLMESTVPTVGYAAGVPLLLIGALLLLLGRRPVAAAPEQTRDEELAGV